MTIIDQILGGQAELEALVEKAWAEPAGSLAKLLGAGQKRMVANGSDLFPLAGKGRCWLILSGAVDLFWTDAAGRFYIGRVPAGGLLDAVVDAAEPECVVAVPLEDTELLETTRQALYAADTAHRLLSAAWGIWIAAIRPSVRPEFFFGVDEKETGQGAAWEVPANKLNHALVTSVLESRRAVLDTHAARIGADHDAGEGEFSAALESMADVVRTSGRRPAGVDTISVEEAIRILFRAMMPDQEFVQYVVSEAASPAERIGTFAQNNGVQVRQIELRDGWWRQDCGPILAFYGTDRQPCALLRVGDRYMLDTGRGQVRVDAAVAAEIAADVYTFCPAFPRQPITPWRVLVFGFAGGGADLRTILFCMILVGLFSLATPLLTGWLIDPIIPSAQRHQIVVMAVLLTIAGVSGTLMTIVQSLAALRLEGQVDNRVESAVWIRILNLPASFFRDFTSGDLANRADSINAMRRMLGNSLNLFVVSGVGAIFSLGLMVFYSWEISILVIVVSIIFVVVAVMIGRAVLSYNRQVLDTGGHIQGVVLQMLASVAKLRVAGAEQRAFLRWLGLYRNNVTLSLRQRHLNNWLVVLRTLFPFIVQFLVLALIGYQMGILFAFFHFSDDPTGAAQQTISTARFASLNVTLGQFLASIFTCTRATLFLTMLGPLYERVRPILAAQEEPSMAHGHLPPLSGNVTFRGVSFRYAPAEPLALRELSFTAEAGKFTALVGPSAAGKSTIVRLLLGLESAEAGAVLMDGNDIRFINRQDLRRQAGVVLQEGSLLSGSVYDNVAAGGIYSPDDVMAALEAVGMAEEVKSWPMGLHTLIGDGSSTISRGQRQLLMIARAVIRKPRLFIFDEATSALDNISQARVTDLLARLEATKVVVAHRLSTIRNADKIVVLDRGTVVEAGTFDALMAHKGLFASLAERQIE